jgi:hypothetical protein
MDTCTRNHLQIIFGPGKDKFFYQPNQREPEKYNDMGVGLNVIRYGMGFG